VVSGAVETVSVRGAAKINLHLAVGAPREDGFHPLDTVYQAVGLYDTVTATRGAPGVRLSLTAAEHTDAAAVPLDGTNIVARAADLLAARLGRTPAVDLHIDKAIPVAGGMAGGSADAGATLLALHELWGGGLSRAELQELAAELGSDVPFALVGGTARGTGRGEIVEPVADAGTYWWVVVPSAQGLSTPAVYRHFDVLFPDTDPVPAPPDALLRALAAGDVRAVAGLLRNDLAAAAVDLRPELGALIDRGEGEGALRGLVSGSGPTCVFLCESEPSADAVAAGLRRAGHPLPLPTPGPVAGESPLKRGL
jgi:4-diphosphocytidyl-2-C-methyl-D-erythritol kinase